MNYRNYILLGAFVLASLAALLWAAIELGGLHFGPRFEREVHFGRNVMIEEGLEVRTAGTKVGFRRQQALPRLCHERCRGIAHKRTPSRRTARTMCTSRRGTCRS